jgi:hypothetical protein
LDLSSFDFKIIYRPGKTMGKPDALSRRQDYSEGSKASESTPMVFLKSQQYDFSAGENSENMEISNVGNATKTVDRILQNSASIEHIGTKETLTSACKKHVKGHNQGQPSNGVVYYNHEQEQRNNETEANNEQILPIELHQRPSEIQTAIPMTLFLDDPQHGHCALGAVPENVRSS